MDRRYKRDAEPEGWLDPSDYGPGNPMPRTIEVVSYYDENCVLQKMEGRIMGKRGGVMYCSREIIESILPKGKTLECYADKVGAVDYSDLKAGLLLPDGATVTGVSIALRFHHDQVAVRIESPDFVETIEGGAFPAIGAHYVRGANGPAFIGWTGEAASIINRRFVAIPLPREAWENDLMTVNQDRDEKGLPPIGAPCSDLPEPEIVEKQP